MFRALCAHHQEVKIVLLRIWYHHTCRWPSGAQVERGLFRNLCRGRASRAQDEKGLFLDLRTGRPPTGLMKTDAV